ncbi:MAG: hypothetical protein MUD03_09625 [Pirellula sp.]|nr:hypothetical protein [Pirellula sp.]
MTDKKLLYIRQCPICEQGLARPRICRSPATQMQEKKEPDQYIAGSNNPNSVAVVLCDECEAIWSDPTLNERIRTKADSDPACPQCHQSLWGPQSHWASLEEIYLLGWYNYIQVALLHTDSE